MHALLALLLVFSASAREESGPASDVRGLPDGPVLVAHTVPQLRETLLFVRFPGPVEGTAKVEIVDGEGEVRTALVAEVERGAALIVWDGSNGEGETLPAGIYVARLTLGGVSAETELVR